MAKHVLPVCSAHIVVPIGDRNPDQAPGLLLFRKPWRPGMASSWVSSLRTASEIPDVASIAQPRPGSAGRRGVGKSFRGQ